MPRGRFGAQRTKLSDAAPTVSGMESDAQMVHFLDQSDAWTQDMIDRFGWALQYVFDGEGDHVPPFCYTIGLHELDHPELLIFGLDQGTSAQILNTAGARIRTGERLHDGDVLTLDGDPQLRVTALTVPNPGEILYSTNRHYHRPDDDSVPALQLVWPDDVGRFPWDAGYELPAWWQPLPGTFRAG
jgi:hypothetical protein